MSTMNASIDKIINYLNFHLSTKTYEHCLRVRDEAIILAKRFDVDILKAEIAGLLHDCAKTDNVLKLAENYNMVLDDIIKIHPEIAHAIVGTEVAKIELNINDAEILNAISSHTLGRENMSKLDKIIFIADCTEIERDFPGVEKLRDTVKKDLDSAMIQAITNTISHIMFKKQIIHPQSIYTYNDLISKKENMII